ncbi:MAG TPA: bifunctional YncE family protein/alkaline phosphatase family protein [Bryobacteraceae bacterium]|jgi:DNA-binding beta-propeller fold protein YncE|nr:bifunctional YncE family protein/alkaline phosphatase family protein [Bryobacteraceae bacterium]
MRFRTWAIVCALAAGAVLVSQTGVRERVGQMADGGFLLSSGWRIKPAGVQIPVDTFPMSTVITPDKKYLLVLNGGYNPPSVSVIDIAAAKELSRSPLPDGWLGLTMTKAGDRVYVGGGSRAAIYEFTLANGVLKPSRVFPVVADKDRKPEDFIGDVKLSPDGHLLYAADLYRDSVVVVNPQSGLVLSRFKTGRRPYRLLFHPSGKNLYVSHWADGTVGTYDVNTGGKLATTRVAPHPTDMVWRDGEVEDHPDLKARLFVAASNTNNVYALGVSESNDLSSLETISLALTPRQPLGMTPSGMALSADGNKLLVACSDANAAAVVDIAGPRSAVLGFVPTGWYPTAAFGLPDGRMGVLNGKGQQSYANLKGPNPMLVPEVSHEGTKVGQYVAHMQTGTVQLVDIADTGKLQDYTREVIANSPYRDEKLDDPGIPPNNPVRPNGPIRHVIYIVKENRTYDQVLGDMKQGNGDPSLVLFGEKVTPNLHKIAQDFVLLDNFYVNSDVSADGHNWATAAIAPDYTQRLWPNSYARRRLKSDYEGQEPANTPPAGYIWSNASQAGITLRNYGYFVDNLPKADPDGTQLEAVHDPVLIKVTDVKYRGWDLDYPDVERARAFIDDLGQFEKSGSMPQLLIMRMGNDHTSGTTAGKIAPLSAAADNDQGVGLLVEAVSKSRFWNETAIFVIEDDAQDGPDHVDSHRSPAWVISPWVKRGTVNSTMYNQASVLRTMEIILGMRPMTTYDAGARPMFSVFGEQISAGGYVLEKPQTPLDTRNPANTASAERSGRMNFKEADDVDDDELNAILWTAIKGPGVPLPVPVRSRFAR